MNSTTYWQQVEELFQAALGLAEAERAQFLARDCGADESLRAEVASLLAAHAGEAALIDRPAPELAARLLATGAPAPLNGQTIRQYRFLELLGQGGMGEVWLARDEKLQRQVAIKALTFNPLAATQGQARLLSEAQAAARLDHPNVCTVYEILEADARCFIVMQYVEGETLAARLQRERLDWRAAVEIAAQIASALTEAHRFSIVHRDIKPQNVMLGARGGAKVLDFGIAYLNRDEGERMKDEARPRVQLHSSSPTTPGLIVGTPGYLSPEQARGEQVDARSDLFSLGVVLYEMLTGRAPFEADSISAALQRTLTVEPEPLAPQLPDAPAALARCVAKLLAKQPERRHQTAEELLGDLQQLRQGQVARQRFAGRWAVVTLLLLCAIAAGAYWLVGRRAPPAPLESLAVLPFNYASAQTEALADGFTIRLIGRLAQLREVRVASYNAVASFKGQTLNLPEAGGKLRCQALLTGRISQAAGGQLNIQVELIDVARQAQLWAEQYQRTHAELQTVEQEITRAVISQLRLSSAGAAQAQLAPKHTTAPAAYEAYLRGLRAVKKTPASMTLKQEALAEFQRALALDSNYAPAWAGLALTYATLTDWVLSPAEGAPKIKAAAQRALALDDSLDDAHHALAEIYFDKEYDFAAGHRAFRRAVELNPNDPQHPLHYAFKLIYLGDFAAAEEMIARARRLEPFSEDADQTYATLLYHKRQPDELARHAQRMQEVHLDRSRAQYQLVRAYWLKGRYAEAIPLARKLADDTGSLSTSPNLAVAYALGRQPRAALTILARFEAGPNTVGKKFECARVYAALGATDKAMALLEQCQAERYAQILHIRGDLVFDKLRGTARFQDLLRRMGFQP